MGPKFFFWGVSFDLFHILLAITYQRDYDKYLKRTTNSLLKNFLGSQRGLPIYLWFIFLRDCSVTFLENNVSCIKQSWGIKSVRFSSKIKRKNQGRFSVIYTKLATISNNHWTVGTNQGCRKQHNLQAGSYVASEVASWPSSNLLFQKKNKRVGGRKGGGEEDMEFPGVSKK